MLFQDRCRPYGDYVVWLQMIAKSKVSKNSIIFITGDVKEDWWLSSQGKTVGPLPSLIHEFEAETGSAFYMYTPHKFLEMANKYLEQEVSQNAVNEIKSAEEADLSDKKNSEESFSVKSAILKGYLSSSEPYLKWINKRHEINTNIEILRRELDKKREAAKILAGRKQKAELQPDSEISAYLDNEIFVNSTEIKYLEQELQYSKIMLDECERHIYTIEEKAALSIR
ncbi:PIN-like domain-containing protein [Pseudomonas sp. NMS19W]|uniref:PIN-like domain-containing protein n=1 Tax=Pseudomonas sp. NMS19W TaxID=3079768 RepID=UPI003F657C5D